MFRICTRNAKRFAFLFFLAVLGAAAGCGGNPNAGRHTETGLASWYGNEYHGRQTASGEIFDQNALTAAHRSHPFGTVVRVTRLENGQSVRVRINDRGPFIRGRVIDLSRGAAQQIDLIAPGLAPVRVEVVHWGGG